MFANNSIRVLLSVSVVFAALVVAWLAVSEMLPKRGSNVGSVMNPGDAVGTVMTPTGQYNEINELKDMLVDLNRTARVLKDSITDLEAKLIRAHVLSDSLIEKGETLSTARLESHMEQSAIDSFTVRLPPPAAGIEAAEAKAAADTRTPGKPIKDAESQTKKVVAVAKATDRRRSAGTMSAVQAVPGHDKSGPWVINLASLPSRDAAERFMSEAGTKDIETSLQQASVRGKNYWRVQVTGLATLEEARSRGSAIKKQLGLKEIWISRR